MATCVKSLKIIHMLWPENFNFSFEQMFNYKYTHWRMTY